jgi:hypothetical protein
VFGPTDGTRRAAARVIRKNRPLGLAAALVVLAGCFSPKYPGAGDPILLAAGDALVFGHLRIVADGREVFPQRPNLRDELIGPPVPDVRPSLFRVEENERAIYARLDDDGRFYWVVPRGTYLVYVSRGAPELTNVPVAAFQVMPRDEAVYVGTLVLRTSAGPSAADQPFDWDLDGVDVADDLDPARVALARRHPQFGGRVAKRLLVYDSELPDLFADYSRRRCARILERCGIRLQDSD